MRVDCGSAWQRFGDDVAEKLDAKPAEFTVRGTSRPKVGCCVCGGAINPGTTSWKFQDSSHCVDGTTAKHVAESQELHSAKSIQ